MFIVYMFVLRLYDDDGEGRERETRAYGFVYERRAQK